MFPLQTRGNPAKTRRAALLGTLTLMHQIVLKVELPRTSPSVPSVALIWRTADWHEREAYDLFGIRFEGHPDPRRIFLPDDWEGHPLRKDYAVGKVPVQFKEAPGPR